MRRLSAGLRSLGAPLPMPDFVAGPIRLLANAIRLHFGVGQNSGGATLGLFDDRVRFGQMIRQINGGQPV